MGHNNVLQFKYQDRATWNATEEFSTDAPDQIICKYTNYLALRVVLVNNNNNINNNNNNNNFIL